MTPNVLGNSGCQASRIIWQWGTGTSNWGPGHGSAELGRIVPFGIWRVRHSYLPPVMGFEEWGGQSKWQEPRQGRDSEGVGGPFAARVLRGSLPTLHGLPGFPLWQYFWCKLVRDLWWWGQWASSSVLNLNNIHPVLSPKEIRQEFEKWLDIL